jgi:hypothetical protein
MAAMGVHLRSGGKQVGGEVRERLPN